jgi:hypothetical protein
MFEPNEQVVQMLFLILIMVFVILAINLFTYIFIITQSLS